MINKSVFINYIIPYLFFFVAGYWLRKGVEYIQHRKLMRKFNAGETVRSIMRKENIL